MMASIPEPFLTVPRLARIPFYDNETQAPKSSSPFFIAASVLWTTLLSAPSCAP